MDQFLELQRSMLPAYVRSGARRAPEPPPLVAAPVAPFVAPPVARNETPASDVTCGRYRVVLADRPLSGDRAPLSRDRVIVLTDDGRGVAERVGAQLRADGYRVATLRPIASVAEAERAIQDVVQQHGSIGALIHLAPLAPLPDLRDPDAIWARICDETRALFLIV